MASNYTDPPKIFWKYYDLFRRKQITLEQFSSLSHLSKKEITTFLKNL
jgi:hypothetical protein